VAPLFASLDRDDTWEGLTSPEILGGWAADRGSGGLEPGLLGSTPSGRMAPMFSPENPLFWAGVVIVLGTGLVAISTHWKVGPAKGSLSL
jgi:hypothetical protein